jgi:hypothetical protein
MRRVPTRDFHSRYYKEMDATPLDQLMPPGGSQQPAMALPSATTYPQMVTPGTSSAIYTPPPPSQTAPMHPYAAKTVLKSIMTYVSVFGAVFIVSLTQVQSLLLRYIPNSYAGSGVVSLTGAAVLGGLGVVLVYILQTLLQPLV